MAYKARTEEEVRRYISVNTIKYNECLMWTKTKTRGYGRLYYAGKDTLVHRIVYELNYGKIPDKMQIHHLCENKACINIKHLVCVSAADHRNFYHSEHMIKIAKKARYLDSLKTHCKHGHEFTKENIWWRNGKIRACKTCNKIRQRETRNRKKLCAMK